MIWRQDLLPQYKKYEQEIDSAIKRVLNSGRYTLADEVSSFEKEFAEYLGSAHAIGVANATDGLILAMKSIGVKEGDEIITTPYTAIPTVSAIIATGATPVFVDINPETFLIDIDKIKSALTDRTKAVIPVHIFGNVVDIDKLRNSIPKSIQIIEDAAQAHGSTIDGKKAGTLGDIGIFSFYPTKNLGGYGDGGAVVTNNPEIAQKIRLLRMYGMTDKDHIKINGVNSRLDEMQAAILRVKLKYLDDMNKSRNALVKQYRESLDPDMFFFQKVDENIFSNFHILAVRFLGDRDKLIQYLDKEKIQTNIYYLVPLHLQEANKYLGYKKGDLPITEGLCDEVMALPLYPELESTTVTKITETISKALK